MSHDDFVMRGLLRILLVMTAAFWLLVAVFVVWSFSDPGAINAVVGCSVVTVLVTAITIGVWWAAKAERRQAQSRRY